MRPAVLVAVLCIGVALALGPSAWACDACGNGDGGQATVVDNRAVEARAFDWSSVSTGSSQSTSPASQCNYSHLDPTTVPMYVDQLTRGVIPHNASFYRVTCQQGTSRTGWWVPGQSVVSDGAFHDVLQEAVDRLEPGVPLLRLSPPQDARHVVGLPTWLAIDPSTFSSSSTTVSAGIAAVQISLTPEEVEWSIGDGTHKSCDGPGVIFDPGRELQQQSASCAHTFVRTPAHRSGNPDATTFDVAARVIYRAQYQLSTSAGSSSGSLGRVAGPVASAPVEVRELQSLRTIP